MALSMNHNSSLVTVGAGLRQSCPYLTKILKYYISENVNIISNSTRLGSACFVYQNIIQKNSFNLKFI